MDKNTQGAWIIHHGRKISGANNGSATYPTIDIAAKAGALLSRMAETNQTTLNEVLVTTLGKVGGLSPKTDLPACLRLLQEQKVIDQSSNGSVSVLGVTSNTALIHTSKLFESNEPEKHEVAALNLGELVSQAPITKTKAAEQIGDECHLTTAEVNDLLSQATVLGFIESDGDLNDPLLFNGNLFRRDNVVKTKRVLDSLSSSEQSLFSQFGEILKSSGAVKLSQAEKLLGTTLLSKLRAAGVFDENIVSNESGDHSFLTSPGSFHKFSNPLVDDAFDHAKALVSALSYGMHVSASTRGQIWGVDYLLRKLLRGDSVGPAPAIGQDYRALELERVVAIKKSRYSYSMRLLKRDVGEIALQVLVNGGATSSIEQIPGAQVTAYTGPEKARSDFRKRLELQPSKSQMRSLLSSVRSGGGI
jgi:hypothetical protein